MARTKQTARKSTGGKAPRKTVAYFSKQVGKSAGSSSTKALSTLTSGGQSPISQAQIQAIQAAQVLDEEEAPEEVNYDVSHESSFYAHFFDCGPPLSSTANLEPRVFAAVSTNPFTHAPEKYIAVSLNSKYDGEGIQTIGRPNLNLVILLDVSGSMAQPFAGESGKTKLDVAKEALHALLGQLRDGDAFGLVIFNSAASVVQPLALWSSINPVRLAQVINALRATGGTNIHEAQVAGTEQYKLVPEREGVSNRIFSLTDMEVTSQDEGAFIEAVKTNARASIFSTVVGVGLDLGSRVIVETSATSGCNYANVRSSAGFKAFVEAEFGYTVTPSAFNVRLRPGGTDTQVWVEGYGSTEVRGLKAGAEVVLSSMFPCSANAKGELRSGLLLFKMGPRPSTPSSSSSSSPSSRSSPSSSRATATGAVVPATTTTTTTTTPPTTTTTTTTTTNASATTTTTSTSTPAPPTPTTDNANANANTNASGGGGGGGREEGHTCEEGGEEEALPSYAEAVRRFPQRSNDESAPGTAPAPPSPSCGSSSSSLVADSSCGRSCLEVSYEEPTSGVTKFVTVSVAEWESLPMADVAYPRYAFRTATALAAAADEDVEHDGSRYQNSGIRKAVLLARYTEFMQRFFMLRSAEASPAVVVEFTQLRRQYPVLLDYLHTEMVALRDASLMAELELMVEHALVDDIAINEAYIDVASVRTVIELLAEETKEQQDEEEQQEGGRGDGGGGQLRGRRRTRSSAAAASKKKRGPSERGSDSDEDGSDEGHDQGGRRGGKSDETVVTARAKALEASSSAFLSPSRQQVKRARTKAPPSSPPPPPPPRTPHALLSPNLPSPSSSSATSSVKAPVALQHQVHNHHQQQQQQQQQHQQQRPHQQLDQQLPQQHPQVQEKASGGPPHGPSPGYQLATREYLEKLGRRALQKLAKDHSIASNAPSQIIVSILEGRSIEVPIGTSRPSRRHIN